MWKPIGTFIVAATLVVSPRPSHAQDDEWTNDPGDRAAQPQGTQPEASQPPTAAPNETPPTPPATPPSPPAQAQEQEQAQQSDADGQWIYTQQYGWIWMPYSDVYTYVPPAGYGVPYAYVFYPDYGWTWVSAPWIWGYGPWPFFGVFGPVHFGWFGHGWWRHPPAFFGRGPHFGGRPFRRPMPGRPGAGTWSGRSVPYRTYAAPGGGHGYAPRPGMSGGFRPGWSGGGGGGGRAVPGHAGGGHAGGGGGGGGGGGRGGGGGHAGGGHR